MYSCIVRFHHSLPNHHIPDSACALAHVSIIQAWSEAHLGAGRLTTDNHKVRREHTETIVALVSHDCGTRVGQPALLRTTKARTVLQRFDLFGRDLVCALVCQLC